jgi:hypothetical protein
LSAGGAGALAGAGAMAAVGSRSASATGWGACGPPGLSGDADTNLNITAKKNTATQAANWRADMAPPSPGLQPTSMPATCQLRVFDGMMIRPLAREITQTPLVCLPPNSGPTSRKLARRAVGVCPRPKSSGCASGSPSSEPTLGRLRTSRAGTWGVLRAVDRRMLRQADDARRDRGAPCERGRVHPRRFPRAGAEVGLVL